MRIAAITCVAVNVSAKTNWTFVRVVADDGRAGIGEASLNGFEAMLELAVRELAGRLAGEPVDEALPQLVTYPQATAGLVAHAARSAVRQALVDLCARAENMPAWQWLGGRRRDAVPVYANVNRATTDRTPEGCAESARRALAEGYGAVKIAPFDGVLPDALGEAATRRAIDVGIARVQAMREALGPGPRLMIDCHWRFDEPTALAVLDRLRDARLYWFECPVSEQPGAHAALGRLAAAARERGVLLAGCELQTAVAGFAPFVVAHLVDAVMPDIKYCGGPVEMLHIAAHADAHGVRFSPHNPTGPVATIASLHTAFAAPAIESLELQVWESPLTAALVGGCAPAPTAGTLAPPVGPGWGVTLDDAVIAAHPYRAVPPGLDDRLG